MSALQKAFGASLVCSPVIVTSVFSCRTIGIRKTALMFAGGAGTGAVVAVGTYLMLRESSMAWCG